MACLGTCDRKSIPRAGSQDTHLGNADSEICSVSVIWPCVRSGFRAKAVPEYVTDVPLVVDKVGPSMSVEFLAEGAYG